MTRLWILLAALTLAGCDGGSSSPSTCGGLQLLDGTFSAQTSGGALTANCFSVSEVAGRVLFIAYDATGPVEDLALPLTITFDGTAPGTYSLDENDPDASVAQIGQTSTLAAQFATSGSATIDEIDSSTLRGTFNFTTSMGLTVSNGRFTVDR